MGQDDKTIDNVQIKEALRRSGYLLEVRASQLLENRHWRPTPNYVYVDSDTGVTRELDIIATYSCSLANDLGQIEAVLLAECMNNPQPLALFERPPGIAGADVFAIRTAGNLSYILQDIHWEHTLTAAHARDWHHCCGRSFASQFCSFAKKKSAGPRKHWPWMASHDEVHFQCFDSLYKGLKHVRQYKVNSIRSGAAATRVHLDLYYPAAILQGELISVEPSGDDLTVKPIARSVFRRGVIEEGMNDVFFIDILSESELESYCSMLENELDKLAEFLNSNPDAVRASLAGVNKEIKAHLEERQRCEDAGSAPPPWPPIAR